MTPARRIAIALLVWLCASVTAAAEPYRLGTEDRIEVRAVSWDEPTRAYVRWDVLDGQYTVQADGTLSLPLAGPVRATGLTLADLTDSIGSALRDRGGLLSVPELAISIIEYRPFYVTGDVAQPGAYGTRPGLTALQAVALAGGTSQRRAGDPDRDRDENLRQASRLVRTLGDLARARARSDRLTAEMEEAETIAFADDLFHPDGEDRLRSILESERAIFTARRQALALQQETLEDLGKLLAAEIENLERKLKGQADQIRLAEGMLSTVSGLASQGLARNQQLAESETRLLALQGEETDLLNNIYRARQRITENARDLVELRTRHRTEVVQDLQRVAETIEQLQVERDVNERLLMADGATEIVGLGLEMETIYQVMRAGAADGMAETVTPSAPIGPGDVLIVQTLLGADDAVTQ